MGLYATSEWGRFIPCAIEGKRRARMAQRRLIAMPMRAGQRLPSGVDVRPGIHPSPITLLKDFSGATT
jgi:hypothetical protein